MKKEEKAVKSLDLTLLGSFQHIGFVIKHSQITAKQNKNKQDFISAEKKFLFADETTEYYQSN